MDDVDIRDQHLTVQLSGDNAAVTVTYSWCYCRKISPCPAGTTNGSASNLRRTPSALTLGSAIRSVPKRIRDLVDRVGFTR